jgi:hypothetical protein
MLSLLLIGLVFATAIAQDPACTRAQLQEVADSYVAAQTSGNYTAIKSLSETIEYNENDKKTAIASGIFSHPLKIDSSRHLLDTVACATYTEVIVTDASHPYVIGVQIRLTGGKVTKIESLVTDAGDWLFNAANTLRYAKGEDWSEIPEAQRNTRETIRAAGDAYCDVFMDNKVQVPWGTPCNRLEGGNYTGRNQPTDSCNVGVPSGMSLSNRRYVVDEVMGSVDIFLNFGGLGGPGGAPDSHQFRILNGKIRYVHTMTVT